MKYLLKYRFFDEESSIESDDFDDILAKAVAMTELVEFKDVHLYALEEISLTMPTR